MHTEPTPDGCRAPVVAETDGFVGGRFGRLANPIVARVVRRGCRADLARLKDILEDGVELIAEMSSPGKTHSAPHNPLVVRSSSMGQRAAIRRRSCAKSLLAAHAQGCESHQGSNLRTKTCTVDLLLHKIHLVPARTEEKGRAISADQLDLSDRVKDKPTGLRRVTALAASQP